MSPQTLGFFITYSGANFVSIDARRICLQVLLTNSKLLFFITQAPQVLSEFLPCPVCQP